LHGWFVQIRSSSLTGSYVMEMAEQREPYESRGSRTVVCAVKASVFSRRQTCRGKSQAPRSLDSRVAGNQDSEAYRRRLSSGRLRAGKERADRPPARLARVRVAICVLIHLRPLALSPLAAASSVKVRVSRR
jgi:hypothetical protein